MTMETSQERRSPERHTVALRLLRRIAILALILSVSLVVAPRILTHYGMVGPALPETLDESARAIATARSYGAPPDDPEVAAAERMLAEARALAAAGKEVDARLFARGATARAVEAQKAALVERTRSHREAEAVYDDLDRQINDLEKLYAKVAPGLEKETTSQLLSVMKVTRATAGTVFLAYEQKDYARVLAQQEKARNAVSAAREKLESAR